MIHRADRFFADGSLGTYRARPNDQGSWDVDLRAGGSDWVLLAGNQRSATAARRVAQLHDNQFAADDDEDDVVEVWVFDFKAEGPEGGDYDGWQSVHTGKLGAIGKLITKLAEHGVDYAEFTREDGTRSELIVAHSRADDASEAVDLQLPNGTEISYGIHRMPVEP